MKAALLLITAAILAAALGLARLGSEGLGSLRLEIGSTRIATIDADLVRVIESGQAPLSAMLFITGEASSPSERSGLESSITALLSNLSAAVPGRLTFGTVDPANLGSNQANADMQLFAAKRGVSSFRAIGSRGDQTGAQELFATLVLDWGQHGSARLEHLGPEHLPVLQNLLTARLSELLEPTPAHVLLLAPESGSFSELTDAIEKRAALTRCDPSSAHFNPSDLFENDLVIWVNPTAGAAVLLPEVERLIDSGRALVLAGSPFASSSTNPTSSTTTSSTGIREVLAGLGLTMGTVPLTSTSDGTSLIRAIAPNQDFRNLTGQPNGTLTFESPAALTFDAVTLDRRVSSAAHISSTREDAQTPKQALATLITPADPRRGRITAFAAATPFEDAHFAAPGTSHRPLLKVLLDSFCQADRRALLVAMPLPAQAVPPTSGATRLGLRALVLIPLPLALAIVYLRRRKTKGPKASTPNQPSQTKRNPSPLIATALALSLAALLTQIAPATSLDLTQDKLSQPAPVSLEIARSFAAQNKPLQVELHISPPSRLPAALAPLAARTRSLFARFEAAGLQANITRHFPGDLSPTERDALKRGGIQPFSFGNARGHINASESRQAWATLRLTQSGSPPITLAFENAREIEELEFRIALALESFTQTKTPRIGFASDLPRMSAAEEYEFQSSGGFAPREGDVFGRARRLLQRNGFDVAHINPRDAHDIDTTDLDALLWMQPRREVRPMLDAFAQHVNAGGRALLAAQHFRTQARQYRGAGFETVFWPQPQLIDVHRFWLPEIGVNFQREVRFDTSTASLEIDTRTTGQNGAQTTDFAPLVTRAPFLIHVPTAQFENDSLLHGVSDLDLADPTAIELDAGRISGLGIKTRPLFHGSPQSWSLDWKGGWLPEEILVAPTDPSALKPRPLFGVVLEGNIPAPIAAWEEHVPKTQTPSAPSKLVLLGTSAPFTDEGLENGGTQAAGARALLLNIAAELALENFGPRGPALARLASRRPHQRGLGLTSQSTRSRARLFVIGGGALLIALLVAARRIALGRNRGSTPKPGFQLPRNLPIVPAAVLSLVAISSFAAAKSLSESRATNNRGSLVFGRLVAPEVRTQTIASLHLTAPAAFDSATWNYAHQDAQWREQTGIGALGDPAAIQALVESLFNAEGQVVAQGEQAKQVANALGFTPKEMWRIEILDPKSQTILAAHIGVAAPNGRAAMLRIEGDDKIWSVDTNPRYILEGTLNKSDAQKRLNAAPPLADRKIIPSAWPGVKSGIGTIAWQVQGQKSLRLSATMIERTEAEMQAGKSPIGWSLIGSGQTEIFTAPPPPGAKRSPDQLDPAGVAAEAYMTFIARSEYVELLDPAEAPAFGFGPGSTPWAKLLIIAKSTKLQPEAASFSISIGPKLTAEQGGGRAAILGASGNLIRLSDSFIQNAFPSRADFHAQHPERKWQSK